MSKFRRSQRFHSKAVYCPEERFDYLQQLFHEFHMTNMIESKRQVLANLCNFAYDPVNYEHLRKLNMIPTLLELLANSDTKLVEFAIGGICNLCNDPTNEQLIAANQGYKLIINCLERFSNPIISCREIILSCLTTLIFIFDSTSKLENFKLNETLGNLSSSANDKRIENLANILLEKIKSK